YLLGKLAGQDLDKFKIRLKDDPAFLQQVQVQKAIISSVETARKNQLKALLVASRQKKKGLIIHFKNRSLAVAASVLSLLAFGLIIKTMLPYGDSNLSETEKQSEQIVNTNDKDTKPLQLDEVITSDDTFQEPDSVVLEPSPEIAIVEDLAEKSEVEKDAMFDGDDDVDFAELKKNEDEIDGDDFKAKRDSMFASKSVPLYVVAYTVKAAQTTVTEGATKKDGLFNRKNKDKNDAEDAEETTAEVKALTQSVGSSVRVEFWVSIVNFKGYKFDGSKLLLFDTPETTPVSLKSYTGKTYLNKNGVWYSIVPNSAFNQMSRISAADILKVLNTK
ncbi:MAG: hypothetical protein ACI9NN_001694, partial [Bacteroidia bacterium]